MMRITCLCGTKINQESDLNGQMYLKYESNANWQRIMTTGYLSSGSWQSSMQSSATWHLFRGKQVNQVGFAVQLPTGVSYFNCQDLCSFTLIILFCAP